MKKLGTLLMIGVLAAPLTIAGFAATQASGSTKPAASAPATSSDTATKTTKKHKKSSKKGSKTAKAPETKTASGGK
jgi:hypothetical protein